jgi:hypothetical protein
MIDHPVLRLEAWPVGSYLHKVEILVQQNQSDWCSASIAFPDRELFIDRVDFQSVKALNFLCAHSKATRSVSPISLLVEGSDGSNEGCHLSGEMVISPPINKVRATIG